LLIETLVRLGRPFIDGALAPADLINQLTNVQDLARDFYQQVFLVEIDESTSRCHAFQEWGSLERGEERRSDHFWPDSHAVAAPISVAVGGNPLVAQGRYALPAYPVYKKEQIATKKGLKTFLIGRLAKTFGGERLVPRLAEIVEALSEELSKPIVGKCLLVLLDVTADTPYHRLGKSETPPPHWMRLTNSAEAGQQIYVDLAQVLKQLWWAKLEEGAAYGYTPNSRCSLCGTSGEVVSIYSKAWPWFSVTWTAPLSDELDPSRLDEAIGLCEHCSSALSYGGKLFSDLSHALPASIMSDAFALGVDTKSKAKQATAIQGVALPFPVLDQGFDNAEYRLNYINGVRRMREPNPNDSGSARHLKQIFGFESILPEELVDDAYRLSLYYYTRSNADVQLWATIEGVSPLHLQRLSDLMDGPIAEARQSLDIKGVPSIPNLIARAYGAGYLWQTLAQVLRGDSLTRTRFLRRMALALSQAGRLSAGPQGLFLLRQTAQFYALYNVFWTEYTTSIRKEEWSMQTWQTLQARANGPANQIAFENVEDLGFVIGHLVRRFAQQFYADKQNQKKDYLRTRVMNFGSALTPEAIGYKALGQVQEIAIKLDMGLKPDFRQQIAATLAEFVRMEGPVHAHRDAFLSAFWAGYGLYGIGQDLKDAEDGSEEDTQDEEVSS